ncbi:MAG: DUF393 domain-containing protein [Bacteroidia bacterium]|nr:DUF393 domain-containing protein [Bacteroidia bacterium]MCX7764546.1 DUF393 domain-containing protein [Bacteroidia bacterium]MDW8057634.1 DUF393 domain-containing protein [Bacteroidia bacterium]
MAKFYYDGGCSVCQRFAYWAQRLFPSETVEWIAADYSDLTQLPVAVEGVIYEEGGRYWVKTEAIRQYLKQAGYPFWASLLGAVPLRWRDWLYDRVAQRRACGKRRCAPSLEPKRRTRPKKS